MWGAVAEFQADPNKMLTARVARLETILGKMGLSPSDWSQVSSPEDDGDEF
jgi:hypothetical protein